MPYPPAPSLLPPPLCSFHQPLWEAVRLPPSFQCGALLAAELWGQLSSGKGQRLSDMSRRVQGDRLSSSGTPRGFRSAGEGVAATA